MLAIALGLSASVLWGFGDFLGGVKSRVLPLLAVLFCSQAVGFTVVGLVTLVSGNPVPPGHDIALAALSAVFGTARLAAFYRAIAIGQMSVVVPISAMSAGLT